MSRLPPRSIPPSRRGRGRGRWGRAAGVEDFDEVMQQSEAPSPPPPPSEPPLAIKVFREDESCHCIYCKVYNRVKDKEDGRLLQRFADDISRGGPACLQCETVRRRPPFASKTPEEITHAIEHDDTFRYNFLTQSDNGPVRGDRIPEWVSNVQPNNILPVPKLLEPPPSWRLVPNEAYQHYFGSPGGGSAKSSSASLHHKSIEHLGFSGYGVMSSELGTFASKFLELPNSKIQELVCDNEPPPSSAASAGSGDAALTSPGKSADSEGAVGDTDATEAKRRRRSGEFSGGGACGIPRILGWARANLKKTEAILRNVARATKEEFKGFRLKGQVVEQLHTLEDRIQSLKGKELSPDELHMPRDLSNGQEVFRETCNPFVKTLHFLLGSH